MHGNAGDSGCIHNAVIMASRCGPEITILVIPLRSPYLSTKWECVAELQLATQRRMRVPSERRNPEAGSETISAIVDNEV